MSTVIDNFFMVDTNKMSEIDRHNGEIEKVANTLSRNSIYKMIVDDFLLFENETSIKNVFEEKYATYQNQLLFSIIEEKYKGRHFELHEFYYEVMGLAEKVQSNCFLNKMTLIYFKTQGDKTLYRIYNTSNYKEIMDNLSNVVPLVSYDYYDNSDLPEGMTKREWSKRGKEYDKLFSHSNSYEDVMNVKICKPSNHLSFRDNAAFKNVVDAYYNSDMSIIERLKDREFSY
jgi:hypothetical protein